MSDDLDDQIEEVLSHLEFKGTSPEWILDFVSKHANSEECELCETIRDEDTDPLLLAVMHPACDWRIFKMVWEYFYSLEDAAYADVMNYALVNPNADKRIIDLACSSTWSTLISYGNLLAHDIGSKLNRLHQVSEEMVSKFYEFNVGGLPEGGCDFFRLDRCPRCGW